MRKEKNRFNVHPSFIAITITPKINIKTILCLYIKDIRDIYENIQLLSFGIYIEE